MIQKQMLEALDAIRIGDDPIAAGPWKITVMAVKFRRPQKLGGDSRPVVLEEKVSLAPFPSGRSVLAEIQWTGCGVCLPNRLGISGE